MVPIMETWYAMANVIQWGVADAGGEPPSRTGTTNARSEPLSSTSQAHSGCGAHRVSGYRSCCAAADSSPVYRNAVNQQREAALEQAHAAGDQQEHCRGSTYTCGAGATPIPRVPTTYPRAITLSVYYHN